MNDNELRKNLADSAVLSSELKEKLSQDCDLLQKEAAFGTFVKRVGPDVMAMATLSATAGLLGYLAAKQKFDKHQEGINKSFSSLSAHPKFAEKQDMFKQRFSELALISPTIASNPALAHQVIEPRMDAGFNLDDIHKLSAIEFHGSQTPVGALPPTAVARAKALSQLGSTLDIYAPNIVREGTRAVRNSVVNAQNHRMAMNSGMSSEEYRSKLKAYLEKNVGPAIDAARRMKKESTAGGHMEELRVSEECLGRMLADAHVMYKSASVGMQGMSNILGKTMGVTQRALGASAGKMAEYFQGMAIPLAIGGGLALLHKVMQQKETAHLRSQAESVYSRLQQSSDTIKENPDLANEAFDALRSFAPSLAAKPLIAKTFIEHVIDTGGRGLTPEAAQQLANTESIVGKLHTSGEGGFIAGLKEPMSLFNHKITLSKHK